MEKRSRVARKLQIKVDVMDRCGPSVFHFYNMTLLLIFPLSILDTRWCVGLYTVPFFSSALFCPPIGTVYCLTKKRNLNTFSLSLDLYYRPSHFSPRRPVPVVLLPLKALNGHVARLPLLLLIRWCQKPVADFFSRVSWHPPFENIRQKYTYRNSICFIWMHMYKKVILYRLYALWYKPLYRIWLYAFPPAVARHDRFHLRTRGKFISEIWHVEHWVCFCSQERQ